MFKAMFSNTAWDPPANAFRASDQPAMNFHNIFVFFLCPLWLLSWLYSLCDTIGSYAEYQQAGLAPFGIYRIAIYLILMLATVAVIVFLAKRRWLGPRLLIYIQILSIVFSVTELILPQAVPSTLHLFGQLIGIILGALIFFYVVTKYYNRRRLMFSPAPSSANESHPR